MNMHIVLHCDSGSSPLWAYTGVYSPYQNGPFSICYIYNPEMTYNLFCEMNNMDDMKWAALEDRGYYLYSLLLPAICC